MYSSKLLKVGLIYVYTFLETHVEQGYWSTIHECALVMSLQMFSLIVDRCNQLLKDILANDDGGSAKHLIGSDIDFLLPPIKVIEIWLK